MNDNVINQENLRNLLAYAHLQKAQKNLVIGKEHFWDIEKIDAERDKSSDKDLFDAQLLDPKYHGELGEEYYKLEHNLASKYNLQDATVQIEVAHKKAIEKINQAIAGSYFGGVIEGLKNEFRKAENNWDLSWLPPSNSDTSIIELLKHKHRNLLKKALEDEKKSKEFLSEEIINEKIAQQNKAYFDEIYHLILENHYNNEVSKQKLIEVLQNDPEYQAIWDALEVNDKKQNRFLAAVQASAIRHKLVAEKKKEAEKAGRWGRFLFPFTCGVTTWGFTFMLLFPYITILPALVVGAVMGWINAHVNYWVSTNAGTNAWITLFVDEYLRLTPWRVWWRDLKAEAKKDFPSFVWNRVFNFRLITILAAVASMVVWGVAASFALYEIGSIGIVTLLNALTGDALPNGLSFHLYSDAFWVVMAFAIPFGIATGLSFAFLCLEAGKKYDQNVLGKIIGHINDVIRISKINNRSAFLNCILFVAFVGAALAGLFFTAYASFDPIVGMLNAVGTSNSYWLTLGIVTTSVWGAIHFYGNGAINSIKRFIRWRSEDPSVYEGLEKTRQLHNQAEDADPLGLEGLECQDIADQYRKPNSWWANLASYINPFTARNPFSKNHQQSFVVANGAANIPITLIGAITAGLAWGASLVLGSFAAIASYAANNRGIMKQKTHDAELAEASRAHSTLVGEFKEGVDASLDAYIEQRNEEPDTSRLESNSKAEKVGAAGYLKDKIKDKIEGNEAPTAVKEIVLFEGPRYNGRLRLINENVMEMQEYKQRNTASVS